MKLVKMLESKNSNSVSGLVSMPKSFPDHQSVRVWVEVNGQDIEFYDQDSGTQLHTENLDLDEVEEVCFAIYETPEYKSKL